MITIKAKSKTGHVIDLQVEEIVSIDGQPYVREASDNELRVHVAYLDGRVTALEAVLGQRVQTPQE